MKKLWAPREVLEYIWEQDYSEKADGIIGIEYMGNFHEFLTPETLQTLSRIFDNKSGDILWLSLVRNGELGTHQRGALEKQASYRLSQVARSKNLGFHRDAVHAPGTKNLRITWLYSPFWSYSSTPTVFAKTKKIDGFLAGDDEFQEFLVSIPKVMQKVHGEVMSMLDDSSDNWDTPSSKLCYWTSIYNMVLADSSLNLALWNGALTLRESITSRMIAALSWEIREFHTKAHQSSLLLFPNGFGPDLSVAHTRHHEWKKEWVWEIFNYAIGKTWDIQKPK